MQKLKNYINGELTSPVGENYIENVSPATAAVISHIPDSDERDVESAIQAAKKASISWSSMPLQERTNFLRKISTAIEARKNELAEAESIDTGKPIQLASTLDIPRSAQNFEFFANAASQFSSEFYSTDHSAINYVLRAPLGVVACISPWNLPLYLLTWKIAPALAMGNTVVAKPSELTPLTASLLAEICKDVGLPPGVLNIVHGTGSSVGQSIVENPNVNAISFTGSTKTGAQIARTAAPHFKKLSLEMGGKNPTIIFEDADFENALQNTIRSAFLNQGQICLCGSRIFVEKSIYSQFKSALIDQVRSLKIGDPLDFETQQGSIISKLHFQKIMSYIDLATQEGGKILTGGFPAQVKGRCENGFFISPTLIEGLSVNSCVNQEEIFGPVATIIPFESEQEVLTWANSTRYGLSASIWTNQLTRAHRFASQIKTGMVWINCWMMRDLRTPFGGVKDSGMGREGGIEALRFFTEQKNICIKTELVKSP